MEDLVITVTPDVLQKCARVCANFLKQQRQHVEPGGVMIGTFDGQVASVKHLLLDELAECTPVSIFFSPVIFDKAEKLIARHNQDRSDTWFILGTWHGHPPGYATFSSKDQATLFREQMRLRTDDPSLALAPWVHFIFPNYGLDPNQVKAFTMQLRSSYRFSEVQLPADALLNDKLASEVEQGTTLGLLVTTAEGRHWKLARYHPDNFRRHVNKEIVIIGLWKYFPFARIVHEFEKVFLENFYQKIQLQHFRYLRLLRRSDGTGLLAQQFECQHISGSCDLSKVITFSEIGIQKKENSRMKITCQNPDLHQSIVLDLPNSARVRDVGTMLAKEFHLTSIPLLYALLRTDAAKNLSHRALVERDRVVLPDDLLISDVLEDLRDPGLPLYFQTLEVTEAKLFELRTQRFRQLEMYDIAKLQKARVLIGGLGLLGSGIAANLATLGVGTLYVIDTGFVDWLNIYRQPLFSKVDVYKRKVDVVRQHLEEMGGVSVKTIPLEVPCWTSSLDPVQMKQHLALLDQAVTECDLVIGAFDKFSPRAVLQFLCLIRHRPFLIAALEPEWGQITLFEEQGKTGCYCCGLPDPHRERWYDGGACTLATLESQRIVAALATKLVVDRLEGKELLINDIIYNVRTMTTETHQRVGSPHCSLCGPSGVVKAYRGDVATAIMNWLFQEKSS